MTNTSKYQMGLNLIPKSMLHLTSNMEYSRQLLKETTTILVLTDSIESNSFDVRFTIPVDEMIPLSTPIFVSTVGFFPVFRIL